MFRAYYVIGNTFKYLGTILYNRKYFCRERIFSGKPQNDTPLIKTNSIMKQILAQVHYMPDLWKSHANSLAVRDEFVKLFQYRFVHLLEELLSPVTTPLLLLFWLRPRAARLVDFLRNFTVEVVGVGDVCSFAQMDTRRHGNPSWMSRTSARRAQQARNGKTQLILHNIRLYQIILVS